MPRIVFTFIRFFIILGAIILPSVSLADSYISKSLISPYWHSYKQAHIKNGFVIDTFSLKSHSEGQGVTMLIAALLNDKDTFDKVYATTLKFRRSDNLTSWSFSDKKVFDTNNACDGDLYIAWALAEASKSFNNPSYIKDSIIVSNAVLTHCVKSTSHGTLLVPASFGFYKEANNKLSDVAVNPSYWIFPAFKALNQINPSPVWSQTAKDSLNVLSYSYFGKWKLPPDWLALTDPVSPWRQRPASFGYDAIRIPLFLKMAGISHPTLSRYLSYVSANPSTFKYNFELETSEPSSLLISNIGSTYALGDSYKLNDLLREKNVSDYYASSLLLLVASNHLSRLNSVNN